MIITKKAFFGELVGTFLLVFFGCATVACAVVYEAFADVFSVAMLWGIGVSVAIFVSMKASGAHLNPAMTIAFAMEKMTPWRNVAFYILAQCLGAALAALAVFFCYHDAITAFEVEHSMVRGEESGVLTAMVFGEYYPNPAGHAAKPEVYQASFASAVWAEFFGTALLALVVFSVVKTDRKTIPEHAIPWIIGGALTVLISLLSHQSMAGFNPARDFIPRLISYFLGWGDVVFAHNGFKECLLVYVLAPILGAITGARVSRLLA